MSTALHWIREQWPCISTAGFLGILIGSLFTRRLMAPSFCPGCIAKNQWVKDFKKSQSPEQKGLSRKFYWLRKKNKDREDK